MNIVWTLTKYPYLTSPHNLPDNYRAVKGVLMSTMRRLSRDPKWKEIYTSQIKEMVNRNAARKLSKREICCWKGPVWYIAHQIAPNPGSKTTPCRLVWNSSQPVDGVSLNSILAKGPDVLNPIRCVLLRFREHPFAFIGDVSKMYNSVFLEEQEVHLHRFLWIDESTQEIETYAILRVNIGDRPAACLAMLATRLTAQFPEFSSMTAPVDTIINSMYVDDILDSCYSPEEVKELQSNVEQILQRGGFKIKIWLTSGVKPQEKAATITLANALKGNEFTDLGLGYHVEQDLLYVRSSVNFSRKLQKMHTGPDLSEAEIEPNLPLVLTKRIVLSQLMGIFDPCGLTSPFKMKGAILFRKTWQQTLGKDGKFADWDFPISHDLRLEWLRFFKEATRIPHVRFPRSLRMPDCCNPYLITFSDGSDEAFGAAAYVRWEAKEGVIIRLIEAKSKLCPLNLKGDTVKSEVCGAVFAARLSLFLEQKSRLNFTKKFHFLDSKTVLGAISKESYGFSTFFANRVGEIRSSSSADDWFWIPSEDNPADLLTRGTPPDQLDMGSFWQSGPEWLLRMESDWPISIKITEEDEFQVMKLQRKAFSKAATRSKARTDYESCATQNLSTDSLQCSSFNKIQLQNLEKCLHIEDHSSFTKLVLSTAALQVLGHAWTKEHHSRPIHVNSRSRLVLSLTPEQLNKAKILLFRICQLHLDKHSSLERLVSFQDENSGLLLTSGRLASDFDPGFKVPILPPVHLAKLLALECHQRGHSGVDATMVKLRSQAWVIRGRRIVKDIIYKCVICRKLKKESLCQIMSDIPDFRVLPNPPFSFCTVDFFGPMLVRGEVNKRTRGKVWGCVFACLSTRAVHVDIARWLPVGS